MPSQEIPLIGSFYTRGDVAKDQQFFNCFPKVNSNSVFGNKTADLHKRIGFDTGAETTANNTSSYGSCAWTGKSDGTSPVLFSFVKASGTSVQIFYASGGSSTQVGGDIATTNSCLNITETSVSGTSNLVANLQDSGTFALEYWYFPEGGAWTQITDGDFPQNFGTPDLVQGAPAHLDGYMFVMAKSGKIYNSDVNSVSSWSANNFINSSNAPDTGTGIARYKDYIVAFKTDSIDFYVNNGNPSGSPLTIVPNASLGIGAVSPVAERIKRIGESVYWIGKSAASGTFGIYRLNGLQAEKISNSTIDALIVQSGSPTSVFAISGAFTLMGMQHFMLLNSQAKTYNFCYCIDTGVWWTLQLASQTADIRQIGSSRTYTALAGYSAGDSKIFSVNAINYSASTGYTDNNAAFSLIARTEKIYHGTDKRKFVRSIWLDADTESTGTATLECSDDEYANWVTLGSFDMTSNEKFIKPGGSYKGARAYRLTHSANTAFRARSLRIEYDIGTV